MSKQLVLKVYLRNAAGIEDRFEGFSEMGSVDGLWLCFDRNAHEQALHQPYVEVRIVSSAEIELNAIKWHSSDK
jgi:hypothetical protein